MWQAVGLTLCTLIFSSSVVGQQRQQHWHPTPAKPYVLRGSDRRLLDRAERFLEDEHWEDAIAALMRLLEADNSSVVAIDEDRFISVNEYCQRRLARMPPEALARYRALVDGTAESWYREGIQQRDLAPLQQLVERYFCSSWGDDALFAMGELALQRGDHQAARNAWLAIAGQGGAEDERLSYPDSELSPATIEARLILLAIREGDWQTAEANLQQFQLAFPDARGRLGGREVALAEHLAVLLQQARQWPLLPISDAWRTFAGNYQRSRGTHSPGSRGRLELLWSKGIENDSLAVSPIVADGKVLLRDAGAVTALDLLNGEEVFVAEGKMFQSGADFVQLNRTLTAHDRHLFGVTTIPSDSQSSKLRSTVWALDLQREGAVAWEHASGDASVAFAGAPVVVDERVYVAIYSASQITRAGIACFDFSTGQQLWQRWLCQASTPAKGTAAPDLLTYDSGILYANTNLGAIAAVRADDGQLHWLRTYQRISNATTQEELRRPKPCIFHQGIVYVLPSDASEVHALEAGTGEMVWTRPRKSQSARLLGVAETGVLLEDRGLWELDFSTGQSTRGSQEFDETLNADQDVIPKLAEADCAIAAPYLVAAEKTKISVFHVGAIQGDQSN